MSRNANVVDTEQDQNFWSARASRDIRLIFHRVEGSVMLCYVAHHDLAYDWASRRKIETHPVTGAAQIVEIRETVREIQIPLHVPAESPATPEPKRPLSNLTEADLLSYGVPAEWIPDVRTADDDSPLLDGPGIHLAARLRLPSLLPMRSPKS